MIEHLNVIELRQYTLHPGRRDELIELFDREFVETQEDGGMVVLGQFRDLDAPDRFVWLRGFADMQTRQDALTAFYDGPVWAAHREQANATMIDSSDARLLRPVPAEGGFAVAPPQRVRVGAADPDRLVVATLWFFPLTRQDGTESLDKELLYEELVEVLRQTGPVPLAVLATETAENTFPRLPIRTGENIIAVFTSYPDETAHRRHLADLQAHPVARDVLSRLDQFQVATPQVLRLAPTGRSLIR